MNDYIEPLLEIQRMSKELHKLTLSGKFEEAYLMAGELNKQADIFKSWCYNHVAASNQG